MRTLVLFIAFIQLIFSYTAFANDLSFIGLTAIEPKDQMAVETITSDAITAEKVTVGSVSNGLCRIEDLIETLFHHYNNVLLNADSDDGRYLRTECKTAFARMLVSCQSFSEALAEIRTVLVDIEERFRVCNVASMNRAELLLLAPQMAKHAQYVTTYNLLLDFATSRQINCDTITPIDEQTTLFVTNWRLERASFIRALYEWKYIPNESDSTFDSDLVRPLMDEAKKVSERAMTAKAELTASGNLRFCDDGHEYLQFNCSQEFFSSVHKNQMLSYSRSFIELRALRNAILTYVILSKAQSIDPIFLYQWNELNELFWQVTTWGIQTKLSCPSTDGKLSTFNLALDKSFQRSYLLTEPPCLVAAITSMR